MEHEVSPWVMFIMASIVIVTLSVLSFIATRKLEKIPTGKAQNFAEQIVASLNHFIVGIMGPKGEKYTPFIGTLFIYILSMNLLGLVPLGKSPTSNLTITLSLSIPVFFFYNYAGIRETGFKPWIKHLVGEPVWLAPLMFPIHVIGELARPISLGIRLYGNIFGEETILAVLAAMTIVFVPYFIAIPTQFPMMLFSIFTSFIQALVFSTLTAIYISIAISNHDEH
ncbi:MAG: F0F1 ATP synthase subunit A [Armatimonadota bacterium]